MPCGGNLTLLRLFNYFGAKILKCLICLDKNVAYF